MRGSQRWLIGLPSRSVPIMNSSSIFSDFLLYGQIPASSFGNGFMSTFPVNLENEWKPGLNMPEADKTFSSNDTVSPDDRCSVCSDGSASMTRGEYRTKSHPMTADISFIAKN